MYVKKPLSSVRLLYQSSKKKPTGNFYQRVAVIIVAPVSDDVDRKCVGPVKYPSNSLFLNHSRSFITVKFSNVKSLF